MGIVPQSASPITTYGKIEAYLIYLVFLLTEGRGPEKRRVKPVEPQSLLDFDLGEGESSDDSDFRIEDHAEESDDYSINTDDEEKSKDLIEPIELKNPLCKKS